MWNSLTQNSCLIDEIPKRDRWIDYETLKLDRLINADNNIYIGIISKKSTNPYSFQAIM